MPKRGECIYKRKDGRWEARYIESYTNEGKANYKSVYAPTYTEVKNKLKLYRESNTKRKSTSSTGVGQLSIDWLKNKRIHIKQSTYANYYRLMHNHILPYFKNVSTKALSEEILNKFIEGKLVGGRLDNKDGGLSAKTIHDLWSLLAQIIKYGELKNYVSNFNYMVTLPKIKTSELLVLSQIEQSKLVKYIKLNFDIEKLGVLLSLFMGVRLGEVCSLTWSDINFETKTVRINKTIQRIKNTEDNAATKTKIIIDTPKSEKSIREIPIPSFLLSLLKNYKGPFCTYILSGTTSYIEPRAYQSRFKIYLKNAGIKDTKYHSLRHTFATRAIEHGFDIKALSEILGHSSVKFTLERYVHPSHEFKKINIEKLAVCY